MSKYAIQKLQQLKLKDRSAQQQQETTILKMKLENERRSK